MGAQDLKPGLPHALHLTRRSAMAASRLGRAGKVVLYSLPVALAAIPESNTTRPSPADALSSEAEGQSGDMAAMQIALFLVGTALLSTMLLCCSPVIMRRLRANIIIELLASGQGA